MTESDSRIACWTHRGGRRSNQDAAVALALADGRELVAVADGMGGHLGGAVASRLALETLVARLRLGDDLVAATRAANRAVHRAARERPGCAGMGTTLVAMLRTRRDYEIVNVGDSRAYRVFDGAIEQITRDHSFLAEARARGAAAGEAERSPWRHAVTRAIGLEREVEVDRFGPYRTREPHHVLLCSDGLSNVLPDELLATALSEEPEPSAAVERLGTAALAAAPSDNVTAAVALVLPTTRFGLLRRKDRRGILARRRQARPSVASSIWKWRLLQAALVAGALLLFLAAELVLARHS